MLLQYRTVYEGNEAEIVEKKSRFIATVCPAASEEEAAAFIESMRKKYWNASHNCFAYVTGENQEIQRYSDDGEPGGTAGKPMLDVLLGEDIHDTIVVVTRYFGGTLLGTGGLVRAYQSAAKAGLCASKIITKERGRQLELASDYNGLGKIQYLLAQERLTTTATDYTDTVKLKVLVPEEKVSPITSRLTEATNGQIQITKEEPCWFAESDGEILLFPIK